MFVFVFVFVYIAIMAGGEERKQNVADGMRSSSELIFIIRNTILFIIQNIGDENPKESFRTVCSLEKTM
jgi:hypothetical protein